jgi:nucleotide-binding universal stress UspA family protein
MSTAHHPAVSLVFKNILLASDLSAASETALAYAQAIARRHQSQLHAVHVHGEYSYQLLQLEPHKRGSGAATVAEQPTAALEELFRGVPRHVPLRHGEVWEVINRVVERKRIDLLVVGTHARKGLGRMLNGSVAEDVLRNPNCPVLTVGPEVKLNSDRGLTISSILLATDFDPQSDAPRYAAWLCNDFHAKLTVLHVNQEVSATDRPRAAGGGEHGIDTPMPRMGDRMVRKMMEETNLWCKPDFILENGQPAAKILEVARKTHPDLIVLGARYAEPAKINSRLSRPTIAKVVAGAECPVLTVKNIGVTE